MNLDNINTTQIEQSTIKVQFPFIYDEKKIKALKNPKTHKLNNEYLKDFLPYTKNFFGKYHFEENIPSKPELPFIIDIKDIETINFIEDNQIIEPINISNIEVYIFEKGIGILSITYTLPENLSDSQYLIYHQKLSKLEKKSKQKIATSTDIQFKYYFEFIDSLILPYCIENKNIFNRANMYTYNILVAKSCDEKANTKNFLEALIQYRNKLYNMTIEKIDAFHIEQTSHVNTISNENVVVHIGIKNDKYDNQFIDNEFMCKYKNNHFLIYIITLYQLVKIEQLIIKAIIEDFGDNDLTNMQEIKTEILHFISNINFTKISNNSIRNSLYKFYREAFEIKDLLTEADTISDKITNKIENHNEKSRQSSAHKTQLLLAIIPIVSVFNWDYIVKIYELINNYFLLR